jgi:hypothetical protein
VWHVSSARSTSLARPGAACGCTQVRMVSRNQKSSILPQPQNLPARDSRFGSPITGLRPVTCTARVRHASSARSTSLARPGAPCGYTRAQMASRNQQSSILPQPQDLPARDSRFGSPITGLRPVTCTARVWHVSSARSTSLARPGAVCRCTRAQMASKYQKSSILPQLQNCQPRIRALGRP